MLNKRIMQIYSQEAAAESEEEPFSKQVGESGCKLCHLGLVGSGYMGWWKVTTI
jgi:cytochrome c5